MMHKSMMGRGSDRNPVNVLTLKQYIERMRLAMAMKSINTTPAEYGPYTQEQIIGSYLDTGEEVQVHSKSEYKRLVSLGVIK